MSTVISSSLPSEPRSGRGHTDSVEPLNDFAIRIDNVSKAYLSYNKPADRLVQMLFTGCARMLPGLLGRWAERRANKVADQCWALKNVSLGVRKGQTLGIIGRNGSGKSTLLQAICGTLSPTSGSITVNGRIAALLELGSGFNSDYTGRENVYLNAQILGLSKSQIDTRFSDIVDFADIGDFLDQPVRTYSSGMYMRLAFAVIAHVDADILVIDEALAVGDAFFTQKCMRFLRNFMATGTVVFVSHDAGTVQNLCTEAIWLEKGVVMERGSPKQIAESYLQAYLEAQQGTSTGTRLRADYKPINRVIRDQRASVINASNLRNDLQVFKFDPNAKSFGKQAAEIVDVVFADEDGASLSWIVGGEAVRLEITAKIVESLDSPIIGFYIKDHLGQHLFGDNTFLTYADTPIRCDTDSELTASFSFFMPTLPAGDYFLAVAIANGTQTTHVHHHWIHEALSFKAMADGIATGLVGIPMHNIQLAANIRT